MDDSYLQDVADNFVNYVRDNNHGQNGNLGDFAMDWVEHGDAIEWTAGNYTVFLKAWLIVLMMFHDDPDLFVGDDKEHPIKHVWLGRLNELPAILDKHNWDFYVWRYEHNRGRNK